MSENCKPIYNKQYDKETIEYAKEAERKLEKLNYRLHDEKEIDTRNREPYSRDYSRIIYSSSFRRLQGKMQFLGIEQTHFFRNRLTHSLEVAQIARSIAKNFQLKDTIVAESCSLAHDLGNPPFGHYGETILNEIAEEHGIDGFEGNAQTLRIITKLEKKHYDYSGLNLTFRTILGVIKYFNKNKENKDDFIYDEDYEEILNEAEKIGLSKKDLKTIDMQIMDLADRIAYAAHDLEDSLNMELFTIDELLYEFYISNKYKPVCGHLEHIINKAKEFALKAYRLKSSEEFSYLFRKELTSKIVNELVWDIKYRPERNELGFSTLELLADGLKKLVFKLILKKPDVQLYEKKGEKVLRGLFDIYMDEKYNKDLKLLPPEYRKYNNEKEKIRCIIDYIAGMMDQFAIKQYKNFYGGNTLDSIK